MGADGAIELAAAPGAATDQGANAAVAVEHDDARLGVVGGAGGGGETARDDRLRLLLEGCVDRRLDDDAGMAVPDEGRQTFERIVDGVFEAGLGAAGVVGRIGHGLLEGCSITRIIEEPGVAHGREHQDARGRRRLPGARPATAARVP